MSTPHNSRHADPSASTEPGCARCRAPSVAAAACREKWHAPRRTRQAATHLVLHLFTRLAASHGREHHTRVRRAVARPRDRARRPARHGRDSHSADWSGRGSVQRRGRGAASPCFCDARARARRRPSAPSQRCRPASVPYSRCRRASDVETLESAGIIFLFLCFHELGTCTNCSGQGAGKGEPGGAAAGPAPRSTGVRDERGVDGRAGAGV